MLAAVGFVLQSLPVLLVASYGLIMGKRSTQVMVLMCGSLLVNSVLRRDAEDRPVMIQMSVFNAGERRRYERELLQAKRAAEQLCALFHREHDLPIIILRTGRFFPEEDDTQRDLSGPNIKANEFLNRRLTVEDAAGAHVAALAKAKEIGFGLFIIAAPTPFRPDEAERLLDDAPSVIARHFPQAASLYTRMGWTLPDHIDRVYDSALAEQKLGFRCHTDFAAVLAALELGRPLPFAHDPSYVSPKEQGGGRC